MKRRDLVDLLCSSGYWLARNGGNHDVYFDGNRTIPVKRHGEIPDQIARKIVKQAGIEWPFDR